jgi:hypothetical protein
VSKDLCVASGDHTPTLVVKGPCGNGRAAAAVARVNDVRVRVYFFLFSSLITFSTPFLDGLWPLSFTVPVAVLKTPPER